MHYHVETNVLISLIKRLAETYSGDFVYISRYQKLCHFATAIFVSEHRHFSNNNLYITSIYSETAVTSHLQLINQESIYTSSWVAVDLNFNSEVFHRTQDFPLGLRVPHSTFLTHSRLWDTTISLRSCCFILDGSCCCVVDRRYFFLQDCVMYCM